MKEDIKLLGKSSSSEKNIAECEKALMDSLTPYQCCVKGDEYDDKKEYTEAFKWYRNSAERGFATAQRSLGLYYAKGKGVEKNESEAFNWFLKAANNGNIAAINDVGICYDEGSGVQKNKAEAYKWFKSAADKGSCSAMYNVGLCYEFGKGVSINYSEAAKWYKRSIDNKGSDNAKKAYARCQDKIRNANVVLTASSSNSRQSNNTTGKIKYLDVLRNYSSYDKIKEDFGKIIRTAKEEYASQTVYRYFYDSGWEKILSVSKETCFMCGGDGKLHHWYMNFPPPSNVCNQCKGTGKELPSVIARHSNKSYVYTSAGEKMYVQSNVGGYSGGSSVGSENGDTRNNSSSHSSNRCKYCGGGGGCRSCNGTGHKFNPYSGHEDDCPSCNGSGRCQICRGSGRL